MRETRVYVYAKMNAAFRVLVCLSILAKRD